jgi:predicted anti-sigma-YlaC factor YlaD
MKADKNKIKIDCFKINCFCDKAEYGEASYEERDAIERHVLKCPTCREYNNKTRKVSRLLERSKRNMLNKDERSKLKQRIKKALG